MTNREWLINNNNNTATTTTTTTTTTATTTTATAHYHLYLILKKIQFIKFQLISKAKPWVQKTQ